MNKYFLATTANEAKEQGITEFDVIIVSADAYVDHPSFGTALIGRYLESFGLKVGIIPQPDPARPEDFMVLGKPRLFFAVSAGNLDSMLSLYTAQRKTRDIDLYSEEGSNFKRPYLPTIIYTNKLKQLFKGSPIVLGGIEASLRRFTYYDFYKDKVRQSILLDSKADMLIYGNAEKALKELINRLLNGEALKDIKNIRSTVIALKANDLKIKNSIELPNHKSITENKKDFALMTKVIFENFNPYNSTTLYQRSGTRTIRINPPSMPLSSEELDSIYELGFMRRPHPRYKNKIPAFEISRYSITSHRGCYGGCNFCSLYPHQGKFIQSRSLNSLLAEAKEISNTEAKKISITDLGGPTANMYATFCASEAAKKSCKRTSCLVPKICKNLNTSSKKYEIALGTIKNSEQIQKIYINTGIRTDLAIKNPNFISELAKFYTMGQLSVAPEHSSAQILKIMNKPSIESYIKFTELYNKASQKLKKKQYIMPYFIIGHPGDNADTEKQLREFIKTNNIKIEQVQEFYPTPLTISTAIYYSGIEPFSGKLINSEKKLGIKKHWKRSFLQNNKKIKKYPRKGHTHRSR